MKGMGRVYDHVTPEMERQISEALEDRWVTSVLALDADERAKLLTWVPVIKDTNPALATPARHAIARVLATPQ